MCEAKRLPVRYLDCYDRRQRCSSKQCRWYWSSTNHSKFVNSPTLNCSLRCDRISRSRRTVNERVRLKNVRCSFTREYIHPDIPSDSRVQWKAFEAEEQWTTQECSVQLRDICGCAAVLLPSHVIIKAQLIWASQLALLTFFSCEFEIKTGLNPEELYIIDGC